MIDVHIIRDKNGFIWQFFVEGHAEYADPGSDIVCAAVSVLTQTSIAALDKIAGFKKYSKRNATIKFSVPTDANEDQKYKAGIILETMVIGLKQIQKSYKKYVSVLDEEV